jgi:ABC-type nitrate/sulfonate/bicarbonate transport system permease component
MSTRTRSRLADAIPAVLYEDQRLVFIESTLSIAFIWWLAATALGLTDLISSPLLVAASFYELAVSMEWVSHLAATTRRTIYGFAATMLVGSVLGIAMGISDFWEKALQDYIIIGLALPSLFAAVFAAMWFGISDVTPMVASAVIAFPFLAQNVYEAVKDIDQRLLQMSSSFGVSRNRVIRRVVVQSVMPSFFAGARYAFSVCWKITTLAELVAAENGIGFMIEAQLQQRSVTGIITWTVLFTLVILILEYGILQRIEQRVFDWRANSEIAW